MTDVFISYARGDAAHQLIEDLLEEAFIDGRWGDLRTPQAAEDQMVLTGAFKATLDAWRERKQWGRLDPAQVMRAHLIAAWRYLQSLDDEEWDALPAVVNDEVAALSLICNPYDAVLEDDNGDPPDDH